MSLGLDDLSDRECRSNVLRWVNSNGRDIREIQPFDYWIIRHITVPDETYGSPNTSSNELKANSINDPINTLCNRSSVHTQVGHIKPNLSKLSCQTTDGDEISSITSDAVICANSGCVLNGCDNDSSECLSITGAYECTSYARSNDNAFKLVANCDPAYPPDKVSGYGACDITRSVFNNNSKENFAFKHKTDSSYNHGYVHNAGANDRHNCVSTTGVMNNSNREQSTNDINDGNARNVAFCDNALTEFVNSDFSYVPNTSAIANIVSDVKTGVEAVTPNSDINNYISSVSSEAVAYATPGFVSNICGNDNLHRISITGSYDNLECASYTGFNGNDLNTDARGGSHYPSGNVSKFGASDITRSSFNNTSKANSDFKHNTDPNNIYGNVHNTDANDGHCCVSGTGVVNNSNCEAGTDNIRDSSTGNIVSYGMC